MSEYDEYKKDKRAFIEARKLKLSTENGGAGLLGDEPGHVKIVPVTPKEKWDNYWYHYKRLTFGLLFAAILVGFFVYDMATKVKYDHTITFVTQSNYNPIFDYAVASWDDLVVDATGNGKVDLQIMPIQLDLENKYGSTPDMVQASITRLTGHVTTMESFMFIVDDESYEYLKRMELDFADLSKYVSADRLSVNNTCYPLKDTEFAKSIGLEGALDKLSMCIIDFDTLPEKRQKKKSIAAAHESAMSFLEKVIEME